MTHLLVHIKNEKTASYQTITAVAFFGNLLFLGFYIFYSENMLIPVAAILSLLVYVAVRLFLKKSRKARYFFDVFGILFLMVAFWWMLLDKILVAILCLVMGVLYHFSMKESTIFFGEEGVEINAPFRKTFRWSQFQNVILKDGLLTLDFKNNQLLQVKVTERYNEQEVNGFFKFHLLRDTLNRS